MKQCQQLTFARCRLGSMTASDKPKTPDKLSSTEADGGDRINVFRRELLVNGKFEIVCPVGFDNVGQCDRFRMVCRGFEQFNNGH